MVVDRRLPHPRSVREIHRRQPGPENVAQLSRFPRQVTKGQIALAQSNSFGLAPEQKTPGIVTSVSISFPRSAWERRRDALASRREQTRRWSVAEWVPTRSVRTRKYAS